MMQRMEGVPLTDEDRAILALESNTIAGHTCKVIVLGAEGPRLDELRAAAAERIAGAPSLKWRLDGPPDEPVWVEDDAFDIERHVVDGGPSAPPEEDGLRREVAGLFAQRLDRSRPLWRIDRLPLADGGTALVWRIHHALADGTAAMRYARALLWEPLKPGAPSPAHYHGRAHDSDQARRRAHLAGFIEREFGRSRGRSPFDGRIGTRREVAFAATPLAPLHDAAKALDGATLNDAVLSVVAGALRRWVEGRHGRLGTVRVKVPVSLHNEGDDAGNRDSFFCLELPLNEADPVERLREVHAATEVRKEEHDAEAMDELLAELGRISSRLRRFCERVERNPRRFALNVSNVPGPREPVAVLGAPVRSLHSIAEIGERHALRVDVVSLAGSLCFGLCADPALVEDLQEMARAIEDEAAALVGAATG